MIAHHYLFLVVVSILAISSNCESKSDEWIPLVYGQTETDNYTIVTNKSHVFSVNVPSYASFILTDDIVEFNCNVTIKGDKTSIMYTFEYDQDSRRMLRGRSTRVRSSTRTSTKASTSKPSYKSSGKKYGSKNGKTYGTTSTSLNKKYPSGYTSTSYGYRSKKSYSHLYIILIMNRRHNRNGKWNRRDTLKKTLTDDDDSTVNVTFSDSCFYFNDRRRLLESGSDDVNSTVAFQMTPLTNLEEESFGLIIGIVFGSLLILGCSCFACSLCISRMNQIQPKSSSSSNKYSGSSSTKTATKTAW
jgi:hypothetical protein